MFRKFDVYKQLLFLVFTSIICLWLSVSWAFFWTKSDLWQVIAQSYSLLPHAPTAPVQKQVNILLEDKKYFQKVSNNADPFLYYVYQETQKRHMPSELALLPLLESDYYPFCLSHVGAEGLWQMMPGTARDLHLNINWWYEGRRDFVKSTQAALAHLNYLHGEYHDWLLALAAYDAGEGFVNKAIRYNKQHHLPTDYWSLHLPAETEAYVPKLLALAKIMGQPDKYHIQQNKILDVPAIAVIPLSHPINLQELARLINVDSSVLLRLNASFRRWVTPEGSGYTLIVPASKASLAAAQINKFNPNNLWLHYKVARGETLSKIAERYQISAITLRNINNLKSSLIKPNQVLLVPIDYSHYTGKDLNAKVTIPNAKKPIFHIVTARETIKQIAFNYKTTPISIRYWNHLSVNSPLAPGMRIVMWKPYPILFDTHNRTHAG